MRKEDGEMGRRGDGEMGRWGDGETGSKSITAANLLGFCALFAFAFFGNACQPNQRIVESQNSDPVSSAPINSSATPVNAFESDVNSMKTANFDFIYVFRRKDGGKMTAEDKKFAKQNSPADTNRFIVSDGETAIIAGSNTRFAPANLEALKSGFVVADFSKSESELNNANANANTNANINANK